MSDDKNNPQQIPVRRSPLTRPQDYKPMSRPNMIRGNGSNVTERTVEVDANGNPTNVTDDEMQELLKQQIELRGGLPGQPPPPQRQQQSDDMEIIEPLAAIEQKSVAPTPPSPPPLPPLRNLQEGPQPPPKLSQAQYEAKIKRDKSESKNIPEGDAKPITTSSKPRFVLKDIHRDPHYVRVNLLSGFIFYEFKDLQVRRINLPDQLKITTARQTSDLTALIDAIGATLTPDVDIRDLTVPDFYNLLYWHRFSSYTSTPFIVNWTSKYGNRNQYRIEETKLTYHPAKITEDEFKVWDEKGFAVPRVRDMEIFQREELTPEETALVNRAQYFKGRDIQDKIDLMFDKCGDSIEPLEQINQFRDAVFHGVDEKIDTADAKFDANKWAEALAKQVDLLKAESEAIAHVNPLQYVELLGEIDSIETEFNSIVQRLADGEKVEPDVETISLNISPLDFFPDL